MGDQVMYDLYTSPEDLSFEDNPLLRQRQPLPPPEPQEEIVDELPEGSVPLKAPLPQEPPPVEIVDKLPEGSVPLEPLPQEPMPTGGKGKLPQEPLPPGEGRGMEIVDKLPEGSVHLDDEPLAPPVDPNAPVGAREAFDTELLRSTMGLGEVANRYIGSPIVRAASEATSLVAPGSEAAKAMQGANKWYWDNMVDAMEKQREGLAIDPKKEGLGAKTAGAVAAMIPDLIVAGLTGGTFAGLEGASLAARGLPAVGEGAVLAQRALRGTQALEETAPTIGKAIQSYFPDVTHGLKSFIIPSTKAAMDAQQEAAARGASPEQQNAAFVFGFLTSEAAVMLPMSVRSELANPVARLASRFVQGTTLGVGQAEVGRGISNLTAPLTGAPQQPFDIENTIASAPAMGLMSAFGGGHVEPIREARPGEISTGAISPAQGGTGALMGDERFAPGHLPPAEAPGVTVTPAPTGEVPGADARFAPPPVPLQEGHIALDGVGAGEVRLSPEAQDKLNQAVAGTPEALNSFNEAFVAENPAHPPLNADQVSAIATQMDLHYGGVEPEVAGAAVAHKVVSDNEKVSNIADEHAQKLEAAGAPKTAEALKAVAEQSNTGASVTAAEFLRQAQEKAATERAAAGLRPIEVHPEDRAPPAQPEAPLPQAPAPTSEARSAVVVGGQVFTGDTHDQAVTAAHQAVGPDAMRTSVPGWVDPQTGRFTSNEFYYAHQALEDALTQSGGDTEHPAVRQAGSQLAEAHARDTTLNDQIVRPGGEQAVPTDIHTAEGEREAVVSPRPSQELVKPLAGVRVIVEGKTPEGQRTQAERPAAQALNEVRNDRTWLSILRDCL